MCGHWSILYSLLVHKMYLVVHWIIILQQIISRPKGGLSSALLFSRELFNIVFFSIYFEDGKLMYLLK